MVRYVQIGFTLLISDVAYKKILSLP